MTPPEIYSVCGAEIPPAERACPECGADDTTGWNADRAVYDGLDLPDAEFDYNEYLKKEFGDAEEREGKPKKLLIWLGLIGLALAVLVFSIALI
ncbi:MAG: zinc ribbon domain-containing protein [Kiritimatiellota bacterium]|nr:zinc ribbon domain-containing protein [Kiritimatiellota bacterium]